MSLSYEFDHDYRPTAGLSRFDVGQLPASTGGVSYAEIVTDDEFSEYEQYNVPDWDGCGAEPITKETVEAARRFKSLWPRSIPLADIAPGADGTIGFEWRSGPEPERTVTYIEVGPGDTVRALRVYSDGRPPDRWEPRPVKIGTLDFLEILFPSYESA